MTAVPENLRTSPYFKPRSCFIVDSNPAGPKQILTYQFERQGYPAVSHGNWDELFSPEVFPASIIPELLPAGTTAPLISRFADGSACWKGATGNEVWRVDLESGATAQDPSILPNGVEVFASCGGDTPVPSQSTPATIPPISDFLQVDDYWCDAAAATFIAPWVTGAEEYEIVDCKEVSTGGRGTLWREGDHLAQHGVPRTVNVSGTRQAHGISHAIDKGDHLAHVVKSAFAAGVGEVRQPLVEAVNVGTVNTPVVAGTRPPKLQHYFVFEQPADVVAVGEIHDDGRLNASVESLNSKVRDELLNGDLFDTLLAAKVLVERCRVSGDVVDLGLR